MSIIPRNSKIVLTGMIFVSVFVLGIDNFALAADFVKDSGAQIVPCGTSTTPDCTWNDLIELINNIINFLFFVSSMIAVLAFCYAGFLYITSAGDGGKVEQAHHIFKMVIIGMLFILCGWLLVATILKILLGNSESANTIKSLIDYSSVDTIGNQ